MYALYAMTGERRWFDWAERSSQPVYAEMHNPKTSQAAPNIDYEYSPNPYHRELPHFKPLTWLNPGICTGQAYGACISGDPRLADIAIRGWKAFLLGKQTVMTPQSCYDLPAAVYWIDRAATLTPTGSPHKE